MQHEKAETYPCTIVYMCCTHLILPLIGSKISRKTRPLMQILVYVWVEAYLVCHGGINEVTCSSDKVLHTSVRDVLQVVIVTTHVRSDVVLLQKWFETLHENVCWSMLSNRPHCRQTETRVRIYQEYYIWK